MDLYVNALNCVALYPGGQHSFMRSDDAKANRRMRGHPFFAPDRYPDLVRCLGGETVELQRGQETDNSMRQCLACFQEAVVRRDVGIGSLVEAAPDAHEASFLAQALEIGPGDAGICYVAGANDPLGLGQGQNTLPRADFIHHG